MIEVSKNVPKLQQECSSCGKPAVFVMRVGSDGDTNQRSVITLCNHCADMLYASIEQASVS